MKQKKYVVAENTQIYRVTRFHAKICLAFFTEMSVGLVTRREKNEIGFECGVKWRYFT